MLTIVRRSIRSALGAVVLSALALGAPAAQAQVSLTTMGTPYTQNFDTLLAAGTPAWTDNTTLPGWYSQFQVVPTNPTTYTASTGTGTAGTIYSYGLTAERALGSIASGGTGNIFNAVRFVNNTGQPIGVLQIAFAGEQWRAGGCTPTPCTPLAQNLDLQVQVANAGIITDANTPTSGWTTVTALRFTTPMPGTSTAAALDGNAVTTMLSGALAVNVNPGQEVWLRWFDQNDANNDHGVAIDTVSVTPQPPIMLSVGDVMQNEGDSGSTNFQFTVSLSAPAPINGVGFSIATSDGTATAGSDYGTQTLTGQSIPQGSSMYTLNVSVSGDTVAEPDETFFVDVTAITNAAGADTQGLGTILNDDAAAVPGDVQFSLSNYAEFENSGVATITVTRVGGSDGTVTVDYATAMGSATNGLDYNDTSGTLTFADGDTSESFSVTLIDDTETEVDETVDLSLTNPTGGATIVPGGDTATLTIFNVPKPGEVRFTTASYTIAENGVSVVIDVERVNGTEGDVTVDYATADVTTAMGLDYTPQSGTLTFLDGVALQQITVPIVNDTVSEVDETFEVRLFFPGGTTLGTPSTTTVTIQNVPKPGTLSFSMASYTVAENGGSATITVTRTSGNEGIVTVDYATFDGTAIDGSDYTSVSGTLTFADGDVSETFSVPISPDALVEPDETVDLQLSDAMGGAQLGLSNAVLTITDVAAPGTLQFSAATYSVAEGGSATITVTRTGGSNGSVTVNYATSNGTATAGSDYTAASGTLTFVDGDTSETFSVPTSIDGVAEGNETVNLTLSGPGGGATLGAQSTAVLTITNTPVPGALQFSAATYSVAEGGSATITVTRTGGSEGSVTVNYATSNGTATAGSDYTAASGTLTFVDGDTSETFSVPTAIDGIADGGETVNLTLSSPGGGASLGAQSTAVLTITNTPVPGTLQFSAATYTVAEGGSATITVTRTGGSEGSVTVNYATSNGTATAGSDYTAASGTLTFVDGDTSETFSVPTAIDGVADGGETVNLTLSGPGGGATLGAQSTAVLTITNTPVPGTLQFSAATYTVAEGGSATITVTRTGGSEGSVTVNYATSNGTATAGTDYTAASGTLTFVDGDTSETFSVPTAIDGVAEGNESVNLTLSGPGGGASLGAQSTAVLTITNTATPGTLQFSAATYTVAEGAVATITVTRTGGSEGSVTVNYATSNGTAGITDYSPASGTLTFVDGDTSETFTVAAALDGVAEGSETVNLTLSAPGGGATLGAQSTAVLTITNTPVPGSLQFSAATYTVAEGGSATITVTRTGGTEGSVTVNYATSNGTATAGSDYTAASGTLTFVDGDTSETFSVPTAIDGVAEGNETVNLTLSGPGGGATLGAQSTAVLTITNTATPGSLQFSAATYTVAEGGGATITVSRTGGSEGSVTVSYATSNGSATAGSDYTAASGTLTFVDGDTSETFSVPTAIDGVAEGNETVNLTLSGPGGGATLGAQSTAVLTITNTPTPGTLQFSAATYSVGEGGSATITVSRTGGSEGSVTVSYATSNGSATAGSDYTAASGTLTFVDGDTSETFTVPTTVDGVAEGDETVNLALSAPGGGATLGAQSTAVLTITNTATPGTLQFSAATYTVAEGGSATITVTRTGGSEGSVTVGYATSDGTATAGTDYTAASGTLTFVDGDTSETFTVPALADFLAESGETVNLALTNPTGGATLGAQATAVLTITNVAAPGTLQFSAATYTVTETGGTATITVTRTNGSEGSVTVGYATSNGTATAGSDYTAASGTLTFADTVTSQTFTVPILDDTLAEGDETVNLALSAPTGGATLGAQNTAVLTITNVPKPGTLQFSAATYSGAENTVATITVTRTNGSEGSVTVAYASSDGTATAGSDYTAALGVLTFATGVTSQTFTVTLLADSVPETNETVNLTLSAPTGGAVLGTQNTAVLTIVEVPTASVTGTKTASGGNVVPGGTVTYTIVLTNGGAGAQADNAGDEFVDVLPSSLVLQSATATSGTAVATAGTNTVTWNGAIAAGASVTITITAQIPAGTQPFTSISNQGTVNTDLDGNGSNETARATDDPGVAGAGNATVFVVQQSLFAIPTLGEWGRIALAMLLLGFALVAVRRRVVA